MERKIQAADAQQTFSHHCLSYVTLCISLAQELPVTANKQLWRENLGNVALLHV